MRFAPTAAALKNPTEACHKCAGTGRAITTEPTYSGAYAARQVDCYHCHGTGVQGPWLLIERGRQ